MSGVNPFLNGRNIHGENVQSCTDELVNVRVAPYKKLYDIK
mgnify:FL=1